MEAPSRPGLRRLAILTVAAFGCATVRAPVSSLGDAEPEPHAPIAAPQLELWLESGKVISGPEQEEAHRKARAALEAALAGRGVGGEDAAYVLYVRERGVARTASRRSDQALAITGIVVGAVALVAVVAVVVIAAAKGGGHVPIPDLPVGAPAPSRGAPVARGAPHGAPAPVPVPLPVPVPVPAPAPGAAPRAQVPPAPVAVGVVVEPPPVDLAVDVAVQAAASADAGAPVAVEAGAGPAASAEEVAAWPPPSPPPPPDAPAPAQAGVPAPALPEAAPFPVAQRDFFAGDEFVLDLVLVERRTGQPVWTKVVHGDGDPRDARAVSRALDEGLRELGLARAR